MFLFFPLLFLPVSPLLLGKDYLVLVDPGENEEYLKPAQEMAAIHKAEVRRFRPGNLNHLLQEFRKDPPRFAVFVLPPGKIDLDLSHDILEMSAQVDGDPFQDFEYGFVTGRDGAAASRFVSRIAAAWKRRYKKRMAFLASWEGHILPIFRYMTAAEAMGFTGKSHLVRMADTEEIRREAAREALASFRGLDALLFFSHGDPQEMSGCFRAKDLREWSIHLSPAILFNSSCYNGAPGRWYGPGPGGPQDKGSVSPEDSVALALLDSGISGYFAGIDAWHGPLTCQVFCYAAGEGLRLGEAAKRMADRLALDFLPDRIHFEPVLKCKNRFAGEGAVNRRWNGSGMIFYGDPALAPFAENPNKAELAEIRRVKGGTFQVRLEIRPLLKSWMGLDFLIIQNRLTDYYSVKTRNFQEELAPEVYRVIPLPEDSKGKPLLKVLSATAGKEKVPTGTPQLEVEISPGDKFIHIRVPLAVRLVGTRWIETIARNGLVIELEGEL